MRTFLAPLYAGFVTVLVGFTSSAAIVFQAAAAAGATAAQVIVTGAGGGGAEAVSADLKTLLAAG